MLAAAVVLAGGGSWRRDNMLVWVGSFKTAAVDQSLGSSSLTVDSQTS